jgi:hypothetical protein
LEAITELVLAGHGIPMTPPAAAVIELRGWAMHRGRRVQQHSNGFPFSAAARLAEADTGEGFPSRSHGVDVIPLHPATTCRPLRAVDLNDPLATSVQGRGQSGTEAAGAFDGPPRRCVSPNGCPCCTERFRRELLAHCSDARVV